MPDARITLRITGCTRCGGNHPKLLFKAFKRPPGPDGMVADCTHWGECPKTHEPVLMGIAPMPDKLPEAVTE